MWAVSLEVLASRPEASLGGVCPVSQCQDLVPGLGLQRLRAPGPARGGPAGR